MSKIKTHLQRSIFRLSTYTKRKHILVYGTSDESVTLAQGGIQVHMMDYAPSGFLTTNPRKDRLRIAGHPVYYIDTEDELKRLAVTYTSKASSSHRPSWPRRKRTASCSIASISTSASWWYPIWKR